MKFPFLVTSLLFCSLLSFAQLGSQAPWMMELYEEKEVENITYEDVVEAGKAYWEEHDGSVRGSGMKQYYRWIELHKAYVKPDGTIQSPAELNQIVEQRMAEFFQKNANSNWLPMGPFAHTPTSSWSPGQGRINVFHMDPNNPNTYYVGAPAGGLWKSTDAGLSWAPLTDFFPQIGVSAIAVDPNDSDIIYIGTGDDDASDSYSVGMLKSTDGGQNFSGTGLSFGNTGENINEIYIDPRDSQTLYISSSDGFYKSTDAGLTVQQTSPLHFTDIKLRPGDPDTIYGVALSGIYKSTNAGMTFARVTNGLPAQMGRTVIAVTPDDPNYVYALISRPTADLDGLYRSTDSGTTWTKRDFGTDIYESPQSWFDLALEVSPNNKDLLLTGCLNIWRSSNGGQSFIRVNRWNNPSSSTYTHADIHQIRAFGGHFFASTDGGIYRSQSYTNYAFTDLTEGVQVGQFYRVAVSPNTSAKMVGGLQDNGAFGFSNGTWYNFMGADGMDGGIDPTNDDIYYTFLQFGGRLYISDNSGVSASNSVTGPEQGNWITPFVTDSQGKVYAGYSRLYTLTNGNFTPVSLPFTSRIDVIEIDPSDDQVIYVGVNERVYKSTDAGSSFQALGSLFPNDVTDIEVDHDDPNTVYFTTSFSFGEVFKSTDGGVTRTNITYNLPNLGKNALADHPMDANEALFVGTTVGVYRLDNTANQWQLFSNNLPNTNVRDLEINTVDNVMTAATYGRGIWQTSLSATQPNDDIAIIDINGNNAGLSCGGNDIDLTVENNGLNPISQITINYTLNGNSGSSQVNQNIAPGTSTVVNISGVNLLAGSNSFSVTVGVPNDAFASNNSITTTIMNNLQGVVASVYDMENQDFLTTTIGSSSLWERGIPNGNILNNVSSGSQAYATNLNGNYPNETVGLLYSGCYDLSNYNNAVVKFKMAYNLEFEWDLMYVQYSTDLGNSWDVLGSANDPNWYSNSAVSGQNGRCFNCVGAQWTGTDSTIREYSYNLSTLGQIDDILFRFVFISDQTVTREGVVIDDFVVEATLGTDSVSIAPEISVYPNPSTGKFYITSPDGSAFDFQVFDISGRLVAEGNNLAGTKTEIDLSEVSSGIYLLTGEVAGSRFSRKLIKK